MARHFWSGVVAVEGVQTGDGRVFAAGALRWDDAALAAEEVVFRWDREDDGGHAGAVEIGRLTSLARRDDGTIVGTGWVDDEWEHGAAWVARAREAGSMGVSVDLDDYEVQVIDTTITEEDLDDLDDMLVLLAAAGDPDPGEGAGVVIYEGRSGDIVERWTSGRVRALTSVDTPAFADARVRLDSTETATAEAPETEEAAEAEEAARVAAAEPDCGCGCDDCADDQVPVTAAGAPVAPPRAWFEYDPDLFGRFRDQRDADEFGSVRVTDEGRVYGYLAAWGVCHTGYRGECVTTPRSRAAYAHFRTGYVVCADGSEVATGPLSMGGGHADLRLSGRGAVEHYDATSTAVADVVVGEDEFGVWFTGALRPGVTDEEVRTLRASSLSGDWRPIGGALELVAALAVNSPGFPIPRARVASGRVQALVAAGALPRRRQTETGEQANEDRSGADVAAVTAWAAADARRRLLAGQRERALARLRGTID